MKLGAHSKQAEQRVNNFFATFASSKTFFVLLALASLILAAGANNKLS